MNTQRSGRRIGIEAGLIILVIVVTLVARYMLPLTGPSLESVELHFLDTRFQMRGTLPPPDLQRIAKQVAIVAMDSDATRKFRRVIPRSVHARLVRQLKKAGARAIIFDVLFIDPGNPADDRDFAAACAEAGNVFLPFDDNAVQPTPSNTLQAVQKKLSYPLVVPKTAQTIRLSPPVKPLFEAMSGGGHVVTHGDNAGKFHSAVALMEADAVYPHVALDAVARAVWHVQPQQTAQIQLKDGYLTIGTHRIGPLTQRLLKRSLYSRSTQSLPRDTGADSNELKRSRYRKSQVERSGTAWMIPLNFIGYPSDLREHLYVPYLMALEDAKQARERLNGRIVIVGETTAGTPDLRPGPFDTSEITLGVETNATFIANLLDNNFLRPAGQFWDVLATVALTLISGVLVLALRPWFAALLTSAVVLGYAFLATYLFGVYNIMLEMTAPLLSTVLGFITLVTYRLVFEERAARKNALRYREAETMLGHAYDTRLVQDLVDNPQKRTELE
ncbi:MAG: CHASE2 domain-containing protein, partial [Armatimonadota bacterium]|nr:CHASE2 domain-containing protein [Armatimonadota bacterium]